MQGKEENQIRVTLTPTDIGDIKLRNLPAILLFQLHGLFTVYAIAHAGTFRPNSVSADVLEFFSGKDDTESKDYIDLCRQVEKMKKKEDL